MAQPFAQALWFDQALLPEGWARSVRIEIAQGMIASVERDREPLRFDSYHRIAVPGIANLHSHAFQRGMAGLAEVRGPASDSFWTWREVMYRFLATMSPDDVEAVAALAYVEMLEAGFTRVGEFHYLHHAPDGRQYAAIGELAGRIVAAASATGIGLTLLPSFYAHGGFGGAPRAPGQRRFVNDLDSFARLHDDCRRLAAEIPGAIVGIAPHSLRAVTPEQLKALRAIAPDGPIHIHVAEQTKEVEDCVAWSGRRPATWLLNEMQPDGRWCFIHATHTTADELARMVQSGVVLGLCPVTEANLGDGVPDLMAFAGAGGKVGVGSDSNVMISLARELCQMEYAQRLKARSRNCLAKAEGLSTGRAVFEMALAGGAAALGLTKPGLQVGANADIVELASASGLPATWSPDGRLDSWVFAANASPVRTVWSCGRKVVAEGRHLARDAIARKFDATTARLLAQ